MSQDAVRILIVDDSDEDRCSYRRWLGRCEPPFEFAETEWGEEGLRLCREYRPDCVLLDYHLPGMSGIEFLDRLTCDVGIAALPAIVMLTGQGNEMVAVEAMKKGAEDYLVKSTDGGRLRQAVQSAIEKRRMRRELASQRGDLERLAEERQRLIEDLREHSQALARANERKDEFLATLAHELRNPLAPICNSLSILRLAGGNGPAADQIYEMMERQVNHMVRLVDDLLEISRITRGKIDLQRERIELALVLRNALETSKPLIEARHHQLAVSLPPEPIVLDADGIRLAQVFANLLNNAAKYTERGGQIWLTAKREENQVVVSVRDTGVGVPVEMLPRVFDLFTQIDRSLGRSQGGLGIGLALVRQLVEMHGGTVEARSDGHGHGCEFLVRLPLAADRGSAGPTASIPLRQASQTMPPRRVLVVDDNADAANSLGMLLKLLGVDVQVAHDGPSALDMLSTYQPQAVLLDIGMPGMDGNEVARRIREQPQFSEVLLIAVTGWGQAEDRRRTLDAGFNHHLIKPVNGDALRALLVSLHES